MVQNGKLGVAGPRSLIKIPQSLIKMPQKLRHFHLQVLVLVIVQNVKLKVEKPVKYIHEFSKNSKF